MVFEATLPGSNVKLATAPVTVTLSCEPRPPLSRDSGPSGCAAASVRPVDGLVVGLLALLLLSLVCRVGCRSSD